LTKKINREIILIGPYPPPYGGISVHIKNLADYLATSGYRLKWLCIAEKVLRDIDGTNTFRFQNYHRIICYLLKKGKAFYHIHVSGLGSFRRVFFGIIPKMMNRSKIVLTLHSGSFPIELNKQSKPIRFLVGLLLKLIDHFICVNELIQKAICSLGIDPKKTSIVPAFAVNCDLTHMELPSPILTFYQNHSPVLATMGYSYETHYGFDLSIRAVTALREFYPRIGLVIAGPKNTDRHFEKLKSSFDLINKPFILIAGEIEYPVNLLIIKNCDVYLRPTDHDGDAVSIREALALNIPVVASRTSFRPDGILLFDIRDYEGMVSNIKNALNFKKDVGHSVNKIKDTDNLNKVLKICDQFL
jgi:glycosyltransferase involved in cell wall biosynthesis